MTKAIKQRKLYLNRDEGLDLLAITILSWEHETTLISVTVTWISFYTADEIRTKFYFNFFRLQVVVSIFF